MDGREAEGADGRAGDGVVRGGEDAVDELVAGAVLEVDHLGGGGLDLVEVEGHGAGERAVEAGLEEARPLVLEVVRPAAVVLTHPGDAGVNGLLREEEENSLEIGAKFAGVRRNSC